MPVDAASGLTRCPRFSAVACPADPCPGADAPGVCAHLDRLGAWRRLPADDQAARLAGPRPPLDPAVRDAVNACPWRGPVLPVSMQDDCGCRGRELSECRAGRGRAPGRVTLRDCLDCRSDAATS